MDVNDKVEELEDELLHLPRELDLGLCGEVSPEALLYLLFCQDEDRGDASATARM